MANVVENRKRVGKTGKQLEAAAALVVSNPDVLGGEPCIKGTRIPAYLVGALALRHGVAEARATYPTLPRQAIELVALYVEANPRKERPRQAELSASRTAAKRGRAKKITLE